MTRLGDQQNTTGGKHLTFSAVPLQTAALAAELLKNACTPGNGDPLRLEVVRTLAQDLAEELRALKALAYRETGTVEGALRAADVANLAACTVPELHESPALEAAAAAHLAAGAARALSVLLEAEAGSRNDTRTKYSLKDARSAAGRARLAARQVDEFLEDEG